MPNIELGQACFGQPWQPLDCPTFVHEALLALATVFQFTGKDNPFDNTGAHYTGKVFQVHAYSWDDTIPQEFNFAWREIRISWYKYLGRGMTINKKIKKSEAGQMLVECLNEIMGQVNHG